MLERCALRNGNVHSADGWQDVLDPVIARYAKRRHHALLPRRRRLCDPGDLRAAGRCGLFLRHPDEEERSSGRSHRPPVDTACGASLENQGEAVLRGVPVSGRIMG